MTVREQAEALTREGWVVDLIFLKIDAVMIGNCAGKLILSSFNEMFGSFDIDQRLKTEKANAVNLGTLLDICRKYKKYNLRDARYLAMGTTIHFYNRPELGMYSDFSERVQKEMQNKRLNCVAAIDTRNGSKRLRVVHAYGPFGPNTVLLLTK